MSATGPAIANLQAGYRALPEEDKRALLKDVAKHVPLFLEDLMAAAGLGKGFRPQTVAERKDARCRTKIDAALEREENSALLRFAARRFFGVVRPEFFTALNTGATDDEGNGDRSYADDLLERAKPRLGSEKAWPFFEAAVRLMPDLFIMPDVVDANGGDEGDAEETAVQWEHDAQELEEQCATLTAEVARLASAQDVDIEDLQARLTEAHASATLLRQNLATAAEQSGFKAEPWHDVTGLRSYIAGLRAHEDNERAGEERQTLLSALLQRLESSRVVHRAPRQQARLEGLRSGAVDELRTTLAGKTRPLLPGPAAAEEWLEWALQRGGNEIETLREQLSAGGLPALAEFVENCELRELEVLAPTSEPLENERAPTAVAAAPTSLPAAPATQVESADSEAAIAEPVRPSVETADTTPEAATPGDGGLPRPQQVAPAAEQRTAPLTPEHNAADIADEAPKTTATVEPPPLVVPASAELREIARAAVDSTGVAQGHAFAALTWRLIQDGRRGLAYHAARGAADEWPVHPKLVVLPPIVRAAAIAPHLQNDTGEIFRLLETDFRDGAELLAAEEPSAENLAPRLLCAAAALRPALLAPRSGASGVLRVMHLGAELREFNSFANPIREFVERSHGVPLNPEVLQGAQSKAEWEKRRDALRQETEDWWRSAEHAAIISKPGKGTWRRMLDSDGVLTRLLAPVREGSGDPGRLKQLRETVRALDSDVALADQAADAHAQGGHRGELVRPAAAMIIRRASEAVQLARRWVSLHETRPDGALSFLLKETAQLRHELEPHYDRARRELSAMPTQYGGVETAAAVNYGIQAIEAIRALLSGASQPTEPPVRFVLHGGLLRFADIQLNAEWEPVESPRSIIHTLARALATEEVPTWDAAFESQAHKRDHEATARIIELLEWQGDPNGETEKLRVQREKQVAACREALQRDIQATRARLDRAVRQGLIARADFDQQIAETAALDAVVATRLDFHHQADTLAGIRAGIERHEAQQSEAVQRRLQKLAGTAPADVVQAIERALQTGDVVTANDYVERAERGAPLPQSDVRRSAFIDFFGAASGEERAGFFKLYEEIGATKPARIASAAHNRTAVCGVDFKRMPAEQADQTAQAIKAWFGAQQERRLTEEQCRAILVGLGFTVHRVDRRTERGNSWFDVVTEPIDQSPVAAFGSEAAGRYRVFAAFSESMESLCKLATPLDFQRHGTLVFYFDTLDERRRRELARVCRERAGAFAVVDTVLLLHVFSEIGPQARLPLLFACALPFARVQPYVTTAGRMPPEIFFGRHREIEELTAQTGSSIVYGGRQLGKTALLRHIAERFHNPQAGRLGWWIDLKQAGLHSPDDVWPALGAEFAKCRVLPEGASRQLTLETFLEHAAKWLAADEHRRILLLLDEADNFLKADATDAKVPFARCIRLRGLMDATGRRFKVVFAGLHNVQRTTRVPNHPLAHYGQPLCIGPLLNDPRDAEEARRLVEEPLAAAGYFFESTDPVVHILTQSNYYPSLIQLYCARLLRHATDTVRQFDSRTTPPYTLTLRHVEDAYNSFELQSAIAEKFRLTLDLDRRYRLIALLFAFEKEEADAGFDVQRLRKDAGAFWSERFDSTTDEEFAELLEEMVGLGVLRRSPDGLRYFLRNPNLIPLLGRADEIASELERFANVEPELEFDPTHFRRPLRVSDPGARSPLSVAQESELRGLQHDSVFVFAGTPAADIDKLREALAAIIERERLSFMTNLRAVDTFAEKLSEISKRAGAGVNISLVPADARWDGNWLRAAIDRTQRRAAEHSRLGVVFVAPPDLAWQHLEQLRELDSAGRIELRTLRPWSDAALRQWLEECQFGPGDAAGRRELSNGTGNWPALLGRIWRATREHDWKPALRQVRQTPQTDLFAAFGCEDPDRRQVLQIWAQLGDVPNASELADLCPGASADFVDKVVSWAQLIGIATRSADAWQLDPLLSVVLNTPST